MPITNPLLDRLRAGGTVGVEWLGLGQPLIAELAADAGPDGVVFDMQHGVWTRETLAQGIAMVRHRAVPLVRTRSAEPADIGEALDLGAMGVIVPMIETEEEARAVVAATRYPPDGNRSAGGMRPASDFKAYVAESPGQILVCPMIETRPALANAGAIAAVEGVDMLLIGPNDLAFSLGVFPDLGPEHEKACNGVLAAARSAGKPCAIFTPEVAIAEERRNRGFAFTIVGNDMIRLRDQVRGDLARFALGARETALPAKPLDGRVVFVTGTNRGIGQALVRALLRAGAKKIYCAARRKVPVDGLSSREIGRIVPVALDVTKPKQVAAAAKAASDVDLLVNNAGVNFNAGFFTEPNETRARAEMEVNYFGTLAMIRAFAPVLKKNGGGTIVNMLSITAMMNLPFMASLSASKAAALSLTQAARAELKAQGTRVVAVLPGAVDTDMTRVYEGPKMRPEEVAAAIVEGLASGAEEILPGTMASGVRTGLALDPKGTERTMAGFLPTPPRKRLTDRSKKRAEPEAAKKARKAEPAKAAKGGKKA